MLAHPSQKPSQQALRERIAAAQGQIPSDLLLRNVRYLDVFSGCFRSGDIAVKSGVIVGLEAGLKGHEELDGRGKTVVPGFIDAHVHVESSMMLPQAFQQAVLPRGTTSAICDPHEIANVVGARGLNFFLDASEALPMDLWIMQSSCVPATHLETNGGGAINATTLARLKDHPRTLGLAEMMNVPGVLNGDDDTMAKLEAFWDRPKDGHCPLLSGLELSAYAASGISSCHESSELAEAQEKLTKGIAVWIREGSVAKDLHTLLPLLSLATCSSMGFCTDDRNPKDIALEGHIDHLVRTAIDAGVAPEVAYRTASLSVARHYGLASGPHRVGAIAPGYQADLILLHDEQSVAIDRVFKKGRLAESLDAPSIDATGLLGTMKATAPEAENLCGPAGMVHVIDVIEGKIITEHAVLPHDAPGVRRLSVLERYGHGLPPANAYVRGFGEMHGAIASSVGHDSHNLIVVGDEPNDMRTALAALIDCGGGFCVVRRGTVLARLPLPFGGLMSASSPEILRRELDALHTASQQLGCILSEPFLQLAFLSLPVIPSLKLTDRGLVDVHQFAFIDVRAS